MWSGSIGSTKYPLIVDLMCGVWTSRNLYVRSYEISDQDNKKDICEGGAKLIVEE